MSKYVILIPLVVLIFVGVVVSANGAGNSIEKEADGFRFEFGIDPKIPYVGEKTIMSLSFHNSTDGSSLKSNNVWIRISKGDKIFFTTTNMNIPESGPLFLSFIFQEAGLYEIDFSAEYEDKKPKSSVDIEVIGNNQLFYYLIVIVAGFLLGFLSKIVLSRIKSS